MSIFNVLSALLPLAGDRSNKTVAVICAIAAVVLIVVLIVINTRKKATKEVISDEQANDVPTEEAEPETEVEPEPAETGDTEVSTESDE